MELAIHHIIAVFNVVIAAASLTSACFAKVKSPYKRVCYYYDPTTFPVEKLNVTVCTHIIYYGVRFNTTNYTFYWAEPTDAAAIEALKKARPKYGYQLMTVLGRSLDVMTGSQENMTRFADAAVSFLRKTDLNGLDIDWEYPRAKYKEPFADLMKVVRNAFDDAGEPRLLLSLAAAGVEYLILESYDIPKLAQTLDFVDIMGYDYRSSDGGFHRTAHHSPLFATKGDIVYKSPRNLNWSASYFASQGMPKDKIVLGIPTYAHGWELLSTENNSLFASSAGIASPATIYYKDICIFLKSNGTVRVWDPDAQSPYAYNGKRWYSFDDLQSVTVKANYVKQNGYGGVMVWSLPRDADLGHDCGTGTDFPIHSRLTDLFT